MHVPKNIYDNVIPNYPACPKCGAQMAPPIYAEHGAVCDYIFFVENTAPARGLHSLGAALANDEGRWVAAILDSLSIEHHDFTFTSGNGYSYEVWAPEEVLLAVRSYRSHVAYADMNLREYLERTLRKDANQIGD